MLAEAHLALNGSHTFDFVTHVEALVSFCNDLTVESVLERVVCTHREVYYAV